MSYLSDSNVVSLVQHYSATFVENPYTYAQLEKDHLDRGFSEVGYHYYIRLNGTVFEGRDLSQPGRFEVGAHSKGENSSSIGICLEGGRTKAVPEGGVDTRTPAQLRAQIELIEKLLQRFPNAVVVGHRDMPGARTLCPGYDARAWWDGVQKAKLGKRTVELPEEVKRVVEDADKEPLLSSTVRAALKQNLGTVLAGIGSWWAMQSEGTQQALIIGLAILATGVVISLQGGWTTIRERMRKTRIAREAKEWME